MKIKTAYGTVEGFSPGGDRFALEFAEIVAQKETEKRAWIRKLRDGGIKAAHPDDGWVDRKRNRVHFCYPHFFDGLSTGNTIVLGWPDRYRRVKIVGCEKNRFGMEYYLFEEGQP